MLHTVCQNRLMMFCVHVRKQDQSYFKPASDTSRRCLYYESKFESLIYIYQQEVNLIL